MSERNEMPETPEELLESEPVEELEPLPAAPDTVPLEPEMDMEEEETSGEEEAAAPETIVMEETEPEEELVPERLDLNAATADELSSLPGIGPALAGRIVTYRQEQPFQEPQDVMKVSGVAGTLFDRIADKVTVHPVESIPVLDLDAKDEIEIEDLAIEVEEGGSPEGRAIPTPVLDALRDAEEMESQPEGVPAEPTVETAFAPPPPVQPAPPPRDSHWGRLILVGLASAIVGALLALAIVFFVNGTLNLRSVTSRTVQSETYRLENEIDALSAQLDSVQGYVEGLQGLVPQLDQAQEDIQNLNNDLAATNVEIDSMASELGTTQQKLASLSGTVSALDKSIAGLQKRTSAVEELTATLDRQVVDLEGKLEVAAQELRALRRATARFDGFLNGLRGLLDETLGVDEPMSTPQRRPTADANETSTETTPIPTMTPWHTPTPSSQSEDGTTSKVTVIPLASPTP